MFSRKGQIVPTFSFVGSMVSVAAALLSLRITVFGDFSHLRSTRGAGLFLSLEEPLSPVSLQTSDRLPLAVFVGPITAKFQVHLGL